MNCSLLPVALACFSVCAAVIPLTEGCLWHVDLDISSCGEWLDRCGLLDQTAGCYWQPAKWIINFLLLIPYQNMEPIQSCLEREAGYILDIWWFRIRIRFIPRWKFFKVHHRAGTYFYTFTNFESPFVIIMTYVERIYYSTRWTCKLQTETNKSCIRSGTFSHICHQPQNESSSLNQTVKGWRRTYPAA